jgi:hypothetical protein
MLAILGVCGGRIEERVQSAILMVEWHDEAGTMNSE